MRQCTLRVKKEQAFLVKTKYKGNIENQKIEFWNLESSHLWNPESTDVESGIHSVESGIQDSPGLPYMGRTISHLKLQWMPLNISTLSVLNSTHNFWFTKEGRFLFSLLRTIIFLLHAKTFNGEFKHLLRNCFYSRKAETLR